MFMLTCHFHVQYCHNKQATHFENQTWNSKTIWLRYYFPSECTLTTKEQKTQVHVYMVCYSRTYFVPPLALILMCRAVIPLSLQRAATSCAASMAAYGLAWVVVVGRDGGRSLFWDSLHMLSSTTCIHGRWVGQHVPVE